MFQTILVNPLLNGLIWLYDVVPGSDLGIAIILLTLIIKLLLFWPSRSSIKSQHQLQDLQPRVDAIRKKYANNKEEMGKRLMELYKQNKVNPLSSCLPLLIQLPIIYALFRAFLVIQNISPETGLMSPDDLSHLYGYLQTKYATTPVDTSFLGMVNLAEAKNYVFAALAGIFAFIQTRMMQSRKPAIKSEGSKDESIAATMTKQTTYILPIITLFFGYTFVAGITLYWIVSTLFQVGQQWLFMKRHKHPDAVVEDVTPLPKQ